MGGVWQDALRTRATGTTLRGELAPHRITADENSPHFAAIARQRLSGGGTPAERTARIREVDVTQADYGDVDVDVAFARHLLAHLRSPKHLIASVCRALSTDGVLVLEETHDLAGSSPTFRRYYTLVQELQAHYGQRTLVGRELPTLAEAAGARVVVKRLTELEIPAARMAALHAANLLTWGRDPYALAEFDAAELEDLRSRFDAISDGLVDAPPISAPLAQIIVTRGASC